MNTTPELIATVRAAAASAPESARMGRFKVSIGHMHAALAPRMSAEGFVELVLRPLVTAGVLEMSRADLEPWRFRAYNLSSLAVVHLVRLV